MTHAARTFLAMLELEELTQLAFAQRCGVAHTTITRFVHGREPSTELLRLLATKWRNPVHGLEILRAHLLDEVERGGRRTTEFTISITSASGDAGIAETVAFDRAIEILGQESQHDPDLQRTLLDLARMIERYRARSAPLPLAAGAEDQSLSDNPVSSDSPVREIDEAEQRRRGAQSSSASAATTPAITRTDRSATKPPPA